MRKTIVNPEARSTAAEPRQWLDVERLARVELTSEIPSYPIESAFSSNDGPGWRAAEAGPQLIRLLFDAPQQIHRIHLEFREAAQQRTQEFTLHWSPDGGRSYREVVRQQYNFGPPDNSHEVEDYEVELDGVTALELKVIPDISHGGAKASLERWMLE